MKAAAGLVSTGVVLAALVLLAGCVTPPQAAAPSIGAAPNVRPVQVTSESLGVYRTPKAARMPPTNDELAVVASAKTLVGQPPNARVLVNGKPFVLDCIGTVRAIYYKLSIDVAKDFDRLPGNGVNRLFMSLKERGVLHGDKRPRPGDVVIWDNTWDANEDGDRGNDPRTHAGVVLAVDDDGTIYYAHAHVRRGVVIEVMNLERPTVSTGTDGKLVNSPLAMAAAPGQPRAEHWLSGELFNRFGDVLRVKDYYLDREALGSGRSGDGGEGEIALALASGAAPAPGQPAGDGEPGR